MILHFIQDDIMPALSRSQRGLHTGGATAHNDYFFLFPGG